MAIALVTKGMISPTPTIIKQLFTLPLNFNVTRNIIKLNLTQPLPKKINITNSNIKNLRIDISGNKLNLKRTPSIKVNIKKISG